MNSFFDDLEAQLEVAAIAQTAAPDSLSHGHGHGSDRAPERRGRRWLGMAARAVPVGLAVLAALVIAVVAVTLLHHSRGPGASQVV